MRIYIFTTIILLISAFSLKSNTKWELTSNNFELETNNRTYELLTYKMFGLENKIYAINFTGRYGVASLDVSNLENDWEVCFEVPNYEFNFNPSLRFFEKMNDKLFLPSDSGMVYHSFDRGETWDSTYLGKEYRQPIKHLKFVNDSVGFLGHIHK